jgi:hypothetical protein
MNKVCTTAKACMHVNMNSDDKPHSGKAIKPAHMLSHKVDNTLNKRFVFRVLVNTLFVYLMEVLAPREKFKFHFRDDNISPTKKL